MNCLWGASTNNESEPKLLRHPETSLVVGGVKEPTQGAGPSKAMPALHGLAGRGKTQHRSSEWGRHWSADE